LRCGGADVQQRVALVEGDDRAAVARLDHDPRRVVLGVQGRDERIEVVGDRPALGGLDVKLDHPVVLAGAVPYLRQLGSGSRVGGDLGAPGLGGGGGLLGGGGGADDELADPGAVPGHGADADLLLRDVQEGGQGGDVDLGYGAAGACGGDDGADARPGLLDVAEHGAGGGPVLDGGVLGPPARRAVHDGRGGGLELGGGGGRGDRGRGWGAGEHVAGGPCGADRPGAGDPGEQAERGQPGWAAGHGLPAQEGRQPGGGGEGGCGQAGQGDAGVEHAGGAEGRAGEGGGAAGDVLDAGDAAACAGVGGPGAHVPGVPVDQCHSDHLPVGVEGGAGLLDLHGLGGFGDAAVLAAVVGGGGAGGGGHLADRRGQPVGEVFGMVHGGGGLLVEADGAGVDAEGGHLLGAVPGGLCAPGDECGAAADLLGERAQLRGEVGELLGDALVGGPLECGAG